MPQSLTDSPINAGFVSGALTMIALFALVGAVLWAIFRQRLSVSRGELAQRLKQAEQVAREQEEALNSLGAARAKAEIKLAELNAQIAQQEIERRKLLREFDEMNVQRMKMELTLCKLQIRSLERELGGADYFE